jgi:hypothetical protein
MHSLSLEVGSDLFVVKCDFCLMGLCYLIIVMSLRLCVWGSVSPLLKNHYSKATYVWNTTISTRKRGNITLSIRVNSGNHKHPKKKSYNVETRGPNSIPFDIGRK